MDRHGNPTAGKASKLNDQFDGKRFNRQHIGNILAGKAEANRFDLITLNFFVYSQKEEFFSNAIKRYEAFLSSMDEILEDCSLLPVYVANPYECFKDSSGRIGGYGPFPGERIGGKFL